MDNSALKIALDSAPQILAAIFSGAAAIVSALSLRRASENSRKADLANVKADVANQKADITIENTDKIHAITAINLDKLNGKLEKEKTAKLVSDVDTKSVMAHLYAQDKIIQEIRSDVTEIMKRMPHLEIKQGEKK